MESLDQFFDWFYRTHPVSATFIGVHAYDHLLPDWSEHGWGDARSAVDRLALRLARPASEWPSEGDRVDGILAASSLEVLRWETGAPHFRNNPSAFAGEAVFALVALLIRPFAPLEVRVEAALERMAGIPPFLAEAERSLRRPPRAWVERAIRECGGAVTLFERGLELFAQTEGVKHPRWRDGAAVAAEAFRRFRRYLAELLSDAPEGGYACGGEALDMLIRRGHRLPMGAEKVLALAEERLAVAQAHLEGEARRLGFDDWRDGLRALADHHPAPHQYYQRFQEVWEKARAAAEAHGLLDWPDYPIRYVAQPVWVREAASDLYFLPYRAPAAFDHLPVVEYLVPPIGPEMAAEEQERVLRATNDSVITLNHVVHHGGLGHHVQNWYAYHRAASRIGRIAAVDCASRIALFCGGTMAEGWATYATDLMEEIGYLTPLDRLSQAHTRLRMAARAIADVQLHTGVWTLEEVGTFYHQTVGMAAEAARAEAVKNSMFPGTALMYLTGNQTIHDLRAAIRGRKGFTLRGFHDRLLSYGSIPVSLIAEEMLAADKSQ